MKAENIERKNLLINGDFQVNQRMQNSYTGDKYSVDLWYIQQATLTIENNGTVTLSGGTNKELWQFIDINSYKEDTLIWCSKINGVVYSAIIPNSKNLSNYDVEFDDFYIRFTTSSNRGLEFALLGRNKNDNTHDVDLNIEYIALYEGYIVSKHQKESYNVALLRCLDFVEKKTINTVGIYNNYSGTEIMFFTDYHKKRDIPTIQVISKGYSTGTSSVQNKDVLSLTTYADVSKDSCGLLATIESPSSENLEGRTCKILGVEILISCEKL